MKMNMVNAVTGAALLFGSTMTLAHSIDAGDVEAGSEGYVGAGDLVIKTGEGECLRSADFDEDNQINACEGIEDAPTAEESAAEPEATRDPEPAPKEPTIIPVSKSIKADFATGSDVPTAEGEAAIAGLIAELSQYQEIVSIDVVGHSDSRGAKASNQSLSERRAATVRDRLVAAFPDAAIASTGFGETQPIASNDTAAGRAENRRVDVSVQAKGIQN